MSNPRDTIIDHELEVVDLFRLIKSLSSSSKSFGKVPKMIFDMSLTLCPIHNRILIEL